MVHTLISIDKKHFCQDQCIWCSILKTAMDSEYVSTRICVSAHKHVYLYVCACRFCKKPSFLKIYTDMLNITLTLQLKS